MSDFNNPSATNFSLPTSTQQKPVLIPVPVEVPVAVPVPVATSHAGVHHAPAPTVNAPTLDSFSPKLDVNAITNSGTPSSQQQHHSRAPETEVRPISDQVSSLASSAQNNAQSLATQAGQIASQASDIAAAKLDEFTAGKPTSDPSVTPVGPPSHDQNKAEEHIDGLTRGIAGVVLTAPLVAVEKLSQTHFVQQVASHLPGHATGGPTLVEQAQPYAQQAVGQAATLATSAKEQAVPLAQQAATTAQNLAGQAAGYASGLLNSVYGAAQHQAQNLQPNPTDTLDELTNRLDKGQGHTTEHHSTAVTAVEPSPVLPIDGAALLPSQGTDKAIDGVDAKYAGGSSSTPRQNQSEGVIGGKHAVDAEQGQVSTGEHEASSVAPVPNESSSVLKNDNHAKNSTQAREEHGAIYEKNIHSDQPPAQPIAPVEHYNPVYPSGGAQHSSTHDSSAPRSTGPPLGLGHPIESAIPLEPISGGSHHTPTSTSSSAGIAKQPKPAEPTPAQFTDRSSAPTSTSTGNNSSSVKDQAKNVDYDDARQKADVATDKGAQAASSALDTAAEKTGVNKDHVPSADQLKKTADNLVTEKITGEKRGHREPIDTSPPTDHDNATPQFLEGEPKAGLGTKIKHLFHKDDKNNSDLI